jgi:multiple sugar transport system ATP-binding protein
MTENGLGLPAVTGACSAVENRKIVYGIRPEHLSITAPGIPATVSIVEPTGAETVLLLKAGETKVTAVVKDRTTANPGSS